MSLNHFDKFKLLHHQHQTADRKKVFFHHSFTSSSSLMLFQFTSLNCRPGFKALSRPSLYFAPLYCVRRKLDHGLKQKKRERISGVTLWMKNFIKFTVSLLRRKRENWRRRRKAKKWIHHRENFPSLVMERKYNCIWWLKFICKAWEYNWLEWGVIL